MLYIEPKSAEGRDDISTISGEKIKETSQTERLISSHLSRSSPLGYAD
jgi:hypothetical protein